MKCDTSSPLFHFKNLAQKLLSVNTEAKYHLGCQNVHHLHKYILEG